MYVIELRGVGPEIDLALRSIEKYSGQQIKFEHRTRIELEREDIAESVANMFGSLVAQRGFWGIYAVRDSEKSIEYQTSDKPPLTHRPPSEESEQPVGVLPSLCEACGQPIEAGRQAGTRFCKRAECIRERQRLAAKKAYDAKYSKSARTASQEAKTDSPLSPSQPQPERSFLTVPGPIPIEAKIFWTLPGGRTLKSGELGHELAAGTIPEGTLLEHSTRGMFRITKRSNGRLAPEQVAADPSPAGPPSPGSAPGANIDPED